MYIRQNHSVLTDIERRSIKLKSLPVQTTEVLPDTKESFVSYKPKCLSLSKIRTLFHHMLTWEDFAGVGTGVTGRRGYCWCSGQTTRLVRFSAYRALFKIF